MNHGTDVAAGFDQTDENILNEVSDQTLEAAAGTHIGGQHRQAAGVAPQTILSGAAAARVRV